MNEKEFAEHQRKVKFIRDLKKAGEGTALQSFRYYRGIYRRPEDEVLLEHQVLKIFQQGIELGEKIGRDDIDIEGGGIHGD